MTSPAAAESAPASKCKKCDGVLDALGYPKWCLKCRAAYRSEYNKTKKEMEETRGYAAGVSAMREHLIEHFIPLGHGMFTALDVARLIKQSKGPFSRD